MIRYIIKFVKISATGNELYSASTGKSDCVSPSSESESKLDEQYCIKNSVEEGHTNLHWTRTGSSFNMVELDNNEGEDLINGNTKFALLL